MTAIRLRCLTLLFGLLVAFLPSASRADSIFLVTLDVSNLSGGSLSYGAGGPYALDFTLTSGDIPHGQTNTVTISDIILSGGGSFTPNSGVPFGQASGDLGSTITLTSGTNLYNDFYQSFVPGTGVSFLVDTTSNVYSVTPDNFSFSILDTNGNPIPTTDVTSSSTLLNVNLLPGLTPSSFNLYAGIDQNSNPSLGPPIVTEPSSVPEPSSLALIVIASGFGLFATRLRRLRQGVGAVVA